MPSQYAIPPYNSALSYKQYDIVYGIYDGSTIHASPYFYATQDITPGSYSPSGYYRYTISAYSLADDVVTLTYTHTGGPPFAAGSQIKVEGVTANTAVNYTGMVTVGGSGSLSYIAAGWTEAGATTGTITALSPAWTTGFMWPPDYTSDFSTENTAITVQFGEGYAQRQGYSTNTFQQPVNLTFRNRSARQMKAMTNFVQDKAGVAPFEILIPDQMLINDPNQKWVAPAIKAVPVSFGRYDVTVTAQRDFNP